MQCDPIRGMMQQYNLANVISTLLNQGFFQSGTVKVNKGRTGKDLKYNLKFFIGLAAIDVKN